MLHDMEMKDVATTSASTVANIASISAKSFEELVKFCSNFEKINGPEKSFPVKFFRSLQGFSDLLKLSYLRKVAAEKEEIFIKLTDCSSWVQAKNLYPEHTERIDDFLDLQMSTKYVPQRFVDFCRDAVVQDSMPDLSVEISIKYNGVDVKNNDLIRILKRKVENELKMIKRLGPRLVEDEIEVELEPHVDEE